jgi:hypothetical protein
MKHKAATNKFPPKACTHCDFHHKTQEQNNWLVHFQSEESPKTEIIFFQEKPFVILAYKNKHLEKDN